MSPVVPIRGLKADDFGPHHQPDGLPRLHLRRGQRQLKPYATHVDDHAVRLDSQDLCRQQVRPPDELRDELGGRLAVQGLCRALLGDGALIHHHDPVRDGHGLFLVVGHVHGGDGQLLLQLLDLAPHVDAELGVQVRQGLVEEQNARADDDGAGQGHTLLLAPGQLVRKLPVVAGEAHQAQDLVHGRR